MIKIIKIKGGLGNQMFGYAFFLALKKANPCTLFLIDIEETVNKHFGLEIFKIFHCSGFWRYKVFCLFHKIKPRFWNNYYKIIQVNSLNYNKDIITNNHTNTYYDGLWQSEKYFINVSKYVRNHFKFRLHILNDKSRKIIPIIKKNNSISIHIRRGDYLNEKGWDYCNLDYYHRAINLFMRTQKKCMFFIFSDDILWCKRNFIGKDFFFVDWNTGADSWQDMYLMSECNHNIIANSTFSWWGAWLNNNPEKQVIAPSVWFKDRDNADCHIIPNEWIKL